MLQALREPADRACLTTIYVGGLRLLEGARLQVAQVDSARLQLLIHGKGGKDRYVPLAPPTLALLRAHWRTHRSPEWLFVAPPRRGVPASVVWPVGPVNRSSLQSAFVRACRTAGIPPVRQSPPTSRDVRTVGWAR